MPLCSLTWLGYLCCKAVPCASRKKRSSAFQETNEEISRKKGLEVWHKQKRLLIFSQLALIKLILFNRLPLSISLLDIGSFDHNKITVIVIPVNSLTQNQLSKLVGLDLKALDFLGTETHILWNWWTWLNKSTCTIAAHQKWQIQSVVHTLTSCLVPKRPQFTSWHWNVCCVFGPEWGPHIHGMVWISLTLYGLYIYVEVQIRIWYDFQFYRYRSRDLSGFNLQFWYVLVQFPILPAQITIEICTSTTASCSKDDLKVNKSTLSSNFIVISTAETSCN